MIYTDTECILRPVQSVGSAATMLIKFEHGDYERAFKHCRGEDYISSFCKILRRGVERVLIHRKREMEPLTNGEKKQYLSARVCRRSQGTKSLPLHRKVSRSGSWVAHFANGSFTFRTKERLVMTRWFYGDCAMVYP